MIVQGIFFTNNEGFRTVLFDTFLMIVIKKLLFRHFGFVLLAFYSSFQKKIERHNYDDAVAMIIKSFKSQF